MIHLVENFLLIVQMMVQVSADQRERLSMSVERLNQSGDRIKESRRTMLETEELGVSILEDLHQQRQTLLHAHNKVPSLSMLAWYTMGDDIEYLYDSYSCS